MGNCKAYKRAIHSIALVFLWILSSNVLLRAEKLLVDEIVESAMPSLVQIHIYDKTGDLWARGSGFFIAPGKILTCEHVMEDAYSARIITSIRTYNRVRILKADENRDLALLKIIPGGEEHLELENDQVPTRDQDLIAIGYNYKNHKNAVSYGIVHSVVSEDGCKDIINSAPIVSGWSGGPLLNLDGYVIGVHKAAWGDGPVVAISTSIDMIKEFLEGPYKPKDLPYAESSELLAIDFVKFGEFWESVFYWINRHYEFCVFFLESFIESHVFWGPTIEFAKPIIQWIHTAVASTGELIIACLFAQGLWHGIFTIILVGILIGLECNYFLIFFEDWRKRKAISKIIIVIGEDNTIEERVGLQKKSDKEIYIRYIDEMEEKVILDWKGVAGKKVACLEEVQNKS